jgi:hypothetical protein
MPNGEPGRRSAGSLLPVGLYAILGLNGRSAESADALVALALEEHFVWAGIRLKREHAAQRVRTSDNVGRTFVTNDRLDADLAPRNALVARVGMLLEIPDQTAEVATTLLETHIDTQVLSGESFTVNGLLITGGPQAEYGQWLFQQWLSYIDPGRFPEPKRFRRDRRPLFEQLGWSAALATRPPFPYRIDLLVATDLPSRAPESAPWTDVSLGLPPNAGTATVATD